MPNQVIEYKCLLISPSDVTDERDALTQLATLWNAQIGKGLNARIDFVRYESHAVPDMSMPAQEAINKQLLEDCDLGIAVFWSKLGTPTAKHPSGSVEEVYELIHKGARVLTYFCNRPIPQAGLKDDQFARLQDLKKEFREEGLYAEYSDITDLTQQVQLHLTNIITQMLAKDRGALPIAPTAGSMTAPTPDVRVVTNPGFVQDTNPYSPSTTNVLTVTVQNHSPSVVYLNGISFEMKSGHVAKILRDFVTGEFQRTTELNPGQSHEFYVDPEKLREHADDYVCAVATDAIGRMYRSEETDFPLKIKILLTEN